MSDPKHPAGHVLQAFRDGELDAAAAAEVTAHCDRCDRCRQELAGLEQVTRLLAGDPTPELPRTVWHRVRPGHAAEPRFRTGLALAACAAGVVLGVLLGPIRFGVDESSAEVALSETMSAWTGDATSPLLGVYQSGQE